MTDSQSLDPVDAFGRLGRIKLAETDLKGVLDEVAHLAKRTIPGAQEVSVTLVDTKVGTKEAYTAAYTGQLALDLDELQYGKGYGPCLDASAAATTLSLPDMSTEDRWPDWAARAAEAGARSSSPSACHTRAGHWRTERLRHRPRGFRRRRGHPRSDVRRLRRGRAHQRPPVRRPDEPGIADAGRDAKPCRHRTGQSIIIGSRHCTPDEAFAILTRLSQDTNRKLREVATALVESAVPDSRS
jgi:hypothetical protein